MNNNTSKPTYPEKTNSQKFLQLTPLKLEQLEQLEGFAGGAGGPCPDCPE